VIRRIQIDNFKSLDGFSLPPMGTPPLANFTCLIGANGSGKSTVLQTLDFISHLIRGNVSEWLRERNWTLQELSSKLSGTEKIYIDFRVEFQTASTLPIYWHCTLLLGESRIINESVSENGQWLLTTKGGIISWILNDRKSAKEYSGLKYSGSVLSILEDAKGNFGHVRPVLGVRAGQALVANRRLIASHVLELCPNVLLPNLPQCFRLHGTTLPLH